MSNSNKSNNNHSSKVLYNDDTSILSLTVNSNLEQQQQQQQRQMMLISIHNKRINEIKKFYIAYYVLLCIDLCLIFVYNNILATLYNIIWLIISTFSLIYYNIIIIRKYKYKYTTTHNNNNINLGIGILLLITTLTDLTCLIYHHILSQLSSFLLLFTYVALTQQSPYYYLLILFYISLNMTFPIVNIILLKRM